MEDISRTGLILGRVDDNLSKWLSEFYDIKYNFCGIIKDNRCKIIITFGMINKYLDIDLNVLEESENISLIDFKEMEISKKLFNRFSVMVKGLCSDIEKEEYLDYYFNNKSENIIYSGFSIVNDIFFNISFENQEFKDSIKISDKDNVNIDIENIKNIEESNIDISLYKWLIEYLNNIVTDIDKFTLMLKRRDSTFI